MQELRFAALESVYDRYLVKSPLGNPLRSHEVRDGIVHSTEVVLGTSEQGDYELTPAELDGAVLAGYAAAAVDMHRTNFSKERTNGSFYWSFLQDHGDLAGAFVEFRDRLEEAVAFVYENGDDAGALRQHMRGDHSALSGGAL